MADRKLVCVDCGDEFDFTEGEQQFFADKGFDAPKRCKPCRQAKKNKKGAGVY